MEKMLQDHEESLPDCKTVKFSGPPSHGEFVENFRLWRTEVEHLKGELCKAKEKEYLFWFGLERFSSSAEDINFYPGFPARDVSGFVSNVPFQMFHSMLAEALFLVFADGRKDTSAMGRK